MNDGMHLIGQLGIVFSFNVDLLRFGLISFDNGGALGSFIHSEEFSLLFTSN